MDSAALTAWMATLRARDGGFYMQHDGEIDVRGAYCAINTATLLQLPLESLFEGTAAWVARFRPTSFAILDFYPGCTQRLVSGRTNRAVFAQLPDL